MTKVQRQLASALRNHMAGRSPGVPEAGRLVWRWFADLCRTRTGNGFGPNPITHAEIDAYARLYRWPMEARHVEMIMTLDRVWMEHARGTVAAGAPPPGQAITPNAFDAVFG